MLLLGPLIWFVDPSSSVDAASEATSDIGPDVVFVNCDEMSLRVLLIVYKIVDTLWVPLSPDLRILLSVLPVDSDAFSSDEIASLAFGVDCSLREYRLTSRRNRVLVFPSTDLVYSSLKKLLSELELP